MAIKWRRDHKRKARRSWYLVDASNDLTYMRVEYQDQFMSEGWYVVICTVPTKPNIVKGPWLSDLEAQWEASQWWKQNREQHLKEYGEYQNG